MKEKISKLLVKLNSTKFVQVIREKKISEIFKQFDKDKLKTEFKNLKNFDSNRLKFFIKK